MRFLVPLIALLACRTEGPKQSYVEQLEYGLETQTDADGDGFDFNEDCDDNNSNVNQNVEETCDGIDNNCDGNIDEGVTQTFYEDTDGDGFGNDAVVVEACEAPSGFVPTANDCDDTNGEIYPGAIEVCDGIDNNCDGIADDEELQTFYTDNDGDGYGDLSDPIQDCDSSPGAVDNGEDCDDGNSDVNPGMEEVCDEIDNNCDGDVDEGLTQTFYQDADSDFYGSDQTMEGCEPPEGYVTSTGDCDDSDTFINPSAFEVCDYVDNDCNGFVDEGVGLTFHADTDSDGFGDPNQTTTACAQPNGFVNDSSDCDDTNADVNPGQTETCNGIDDDCNGSNDDGLTFVDYFADADGDGFGDLNQLTNACTQPNGTVTNSSDCNDANPAINPGESEVCNGIDDDCNGAVDDGLSFVNYYTDSDSDGFGDPNQNTNACSQPSGTVTDNSDCDDGNAATNPNGSEVCNGIDDDCDGLVDVGASDAINFYPDFDGDNFGAGNPILQCSAPLGYTATNTDCDDTNSAVNPSASESCNGIDDDCNGIADDGLPTSNFYADNDGDGFGDQNLSFTSCTQPNGTVTNDTDCNDTNATINPNGVEVCNGDDDDCNTLIDDGLTFSDYYLDSDGDGFGNPNSSVNACAQPNGTVNSNSDCDDSNAAVNPNETEVCNGIDDDCDTFIDEANNTNTPQWYFDADGDGYGDGPSVSSCNQPTGYVTLDGDCDDANVSINPGAYEDCDGFDNDCDGSIDSASSCPCNFQQYNNSSYLFCTSSKSWYDAQNYCYDYGYHMLTITSNAENNWTDSTADSYSTAKWWIGLNDLGQEGNFQWEDGTPVSFTKWHPGEPNNAGGNEDCTQHNRFANGYWNDEPCSSPFQFICEANP